MEKKATVKKIVITVQEYDAGENLLDTEYIVFEDVGVLKEIHEEPVEAVMLALQIAANMKRYADPGGHFTVESQKGKWEFDVDKWVEK